MTVFKGYMTLIKRNLGLGIMYFAIFIVIALMVARMNNNSTNESFQETKLKITIIDRDKSSLSKGLHDYLSRYHNLVSVADDKASLQNALFNRNTYYILTIPKGFEADTSMTNEKLSVSKVPDSTTGMYVDAQVDSFLNSVKALLKGGYSIEEAVTTTLSYTNEEDQILLRDKNGNNGKQPQYSFFYQFYPYLILSLLCFISSSVIIVFRGREVKRRMALSSFSIKRQNAQLSLAYVLTGIITWLLCVIVSLLFYKRDFVSSPNFIWHLINSFLMMLVAMSISFLVGVLVKREVILTPVANVITLGTSFLCGVFVPLEFLSAKVQTVSKFLPVYWYEKGNILLYSYQNLDTKRLHTFLGYLLIQLLFAVAILAVAFMMTRLKQQEE